MKLCLLAQGTSRAFILSFLFIYSPLLRVRVHFTLHEYLPMYHSNLTPLQFIVILQGGD